MIPERWQQADQLLQAALELAPEARAAFLAENCAGDAELQQEVETLLQFHQRLDGFLDQPPVSAMAEAFVSKPIERAGQTVGRYRIVRAIGQGGMGEVYLARDVQLGRSAALKLLPERFTLDPDRLNRFRQEARAASALNHPNILTIYEIGEADGVHFIAAEFVEGRTLRALIESNELKLGQVLDIACQATSALVAAHQAGIIHRDIKPENLMLRPDGYVKVLDFGLAKLSERTPATNSYVIGFPTVETESGMVLGTVSYMSPEQARGLEVDARTDIFSLGVVLYELLTCCQPFTGLTASDVLAALLTAEPLPLAKFVPQIPAELQSIVSRALAKDREERYQSAAELLDDLKRLKHQLELKAQPGWFRKASPSLLELPLKRVVNRQAAPVTLITGKPGARSTTRLRALLDSLKSSKFSAARWSGLVVSAAFILMLAVWGANKYLHSARSETPINTLAVLPFTNALNEPQMEYLTDGITEGIIDNLSQLPALRVMARGTVFKYKGGEVDPRQVGAVLHVRAVVLGYVQRQGERLLIHAELVDTVDGARLWGEQYQHPLADLPAVQGQIAGEISERLRLRLSGEQQRQLAKRQSANSEAYRLYLLGRHSFLQHTRASEEKALAYYNQAIALDPNYALAYSGVAEVYAAFSAQYLPPSEAMPKARQAALKAFELDETLPEAHYALARVKIWGDWDWAGAERESKRALELNSNFVSAHVSYANLLSQQGRFAEALREARQAQELDPRSTDASYALGLSCYFARQYEEALVHFQKIIEISPNSNGGHFRLGLVLSQQGKHQEAISELRQAFALGQGHANRGWLAYGYARAGQRAEALKLLRELETLAKHERISPVYLARIYAGLGEQEQALDWLQKGYDEHSDHLLNLGQDPVYDPLRSNPRFIKMLRGIGLAP